jgi:uncharacterized repeat protein (TIGR03803 family)
MTRFSHREMSAIALLALTTLFTVTSAHAQYKVLYSFGQNGGADVVSPTGAIAQGDDGALYSTAPNGGANNWGGVFKFTPALGTEKLLYSFCALTHCSDGDLPATGLSLRPDGHFTGTTGVSNGYNGPATIFDISTTGTLTTLLALTNPEDGGEPTVSPIWGPDGQFYGTTTNGGAFSINCGTVYRLSSIYSVIYKFHKVDGCNPVGLVLGTDGSFYGTTRSGGTANAGVFFKITYRPGQSTLFSVLGEFTSTYGSPIGSLVEGSDGNYYGVTAGVSNTSSFGSIFQATAAGVITTLHILNGSSDGKYPGAALTFASDGNLYGTTQGGGSASGGTLFKITTTGAYSVLYNFPGQNYGFNPTTTMQDTSGLLYGDTLYGGAYSGSSYNCSYNQNAGCGVFYSWNATLPAFVSSIQLMGPVGSTVEIVGQGFHADSDVLFNGVLTSSTTKSANYIVATVPDGATSGYITVYSGDGYVPSIRPFIVTP